MEAILLSLCSFLSTLGGGILGIKNRKHLHYIMSFTAGVLIAVCFFDILPEAFNTIQANHLEVTPMLIAVVCGFLLIHILEKFAIIHHSHEEDYAEHKHPIVGKISASGLVFHSFLDGIGIGLGFHVNPHVGLLIAIAVIAHDFSDGLNTVTLLLTNKNPLNRAVLFLIADAIAPIVGVIATFMFSIPENILVLYLGFFAGFLLYIGASDLLPEAHSKHSSPKMIGLTVLGVIFIFIVARLA